MTYKSMRGFAAEYLFWNPTMKEWVGAANHHVRKRLKRAEFQFSWDQKGIPSHQWDEAYKILDEDNSFRKIDKEIPLPGIGSAIEAEVVDEIEVGNGAIKRANPKPVLMVETRTMKLACYEPTDLRADIETLERGANDVLGLIVDSLASKAYSVGKNVGDEIDHTAAQIRLTVAQSFAEGAGLESDESHQE